MSIGYPDFSRTQAQAGNQLGSFFGQKQNDPTTGVMDDIGYAYLTMQVNDTGNIHNFQMTITWYDDHGATNIVNTSQFVPVPGSNISYQIPVVSRYVRVTVSHQVALDTEVVGGIVYGSNVLTPQAIVGPQFRPFMTTSISVAAGGNVMINALYTYWGPATFYASTSSGTAYAAQINYYDMAFAAFKTLISLNGATHGADVISRISLPPCPVQMVLINNDSVARTLVGTVTLG